MNNKAILITHTVGDSDVRDICHNGSCRCVHEFQRPAIVGLLKFILRAESLIFVNKAKNIWDEAGKALLCEPTTVYPNHNPSSGK